MAKKSTTALAKVDTEASVASKVAAAILGFVGDVPSTDERQSLTPAESSRKAARTAAAKAAALAGTLALPPGPVGWITILPEMISVWKIQAQMVVDISAFYGKKGTLTREQMIYCLFKHTASQAVRDLVIRVGERVLFKRASLRVLQTIAQRIGINVTQRVIAKSVSRWLPVVGAVGVSAYAYYDTTQVAKMAIELFEQERETPSEVKPPSF